LFGFALALAIAIHDLNMLGY